MSSSNAVQIILVPETTYGVTPAPGAAVVAQPVRFVNETLSGTPQTTESAESRNDRMSGGQVVTGLESGGDINGELSHGITVDTLFRMGMMSEWVDGIAVTAPVAATQTKVPGNDQLADVVFTGVDLDDIDGADGAIAVGDLITLMGFPSAVNNGPRQVQTITLPNTVRIVTPRTATTESTVGATVDLGRARYLDIGAQVFSATFSKAYTDVTHEATPNQHSQRYPGGLVNQIAVNLTWGAICTSNFSIVANGYVQEAPSLAQQIVTAGGTVPPAETQQPLNASVDMPMVTVDGEPTDYCVQSLTFTLNNNMTPQNCIGKIAPTKYNAGTASIAVTASIYLGDSAYDRFMPAKLTQQPISFLFAALNEDGGYAFDFRAVQLVFPDPASGGKDQQVMIEATGVAKVGENGESALRIYDLGAVA